MSAALVAEVGAMEVQQDAEKIVQIAASGAVLDPEEARPGLRLSAADALEIWAVYQTGGSLLTAGLRPTAGGAAGESHGFAVHNHVEKFFRRRAPGDRKLMLHVQHHDDARTMQWREPGVRRADTLARLKWRRYESLADADVPAVAYSVVKVEFAKWYREHPAVLQPSHTGIDREDVREAAAANVANAAMNTHQAAEVLQKTPRAVANMCDRGQLKALKIEGQWRIQARSVWALQDRRRRKEVLAELGRRKRARRKKF